MKPVPFSSEERYATVDVQGKTFLFTNLRVDRDTIPVGFVAYDVGDDCDGNFCRIQPSVLVNHWGTIIGCDDLALDRNGQYWPDAGTDEFFGDYGDAMTLAEYLLTCQST